MLFLSHIGYIYRNMLFCLILIHFISKFSFIFEIRTTPISRCVPKLSRNKTCQRTHKSSIFFKKGLFLFLCLFVFIHCIFGVYEIKRKNFSSHMNFQILSSEPYSWCSFHIDFFINLQ